MPAQRIGLNLYSLREQCGDPAALTSTLKRVHEIGYRYVQISGLGATEPSAIVDALEKSAMRACATHVSWDRFVESPDAMVDLHRKYATTHSAIGSLPEAYRGEDGVARFVGEAAKVLPILSAAGIDFSYHNHNQEFAHIAPGVTWIDALHQAAKKAAVPIKFEIDTHWVVAGGADPAAYIRRFAAAMSIVHVKDMAVTPTREQRFAPVGSGNLNWQAIFEEIRLSPIEFVIVEQDAHYESDPFENVAASFRFLRENGFLAE